MKKQNILGKDERKKRVMELSMHESSFAIELIDLQIANSSPSKKNSVTSHFCNRGTYCPGRGETGLASGSRAVQESGQDNAGEFAFKRHASERLN